jgi:hypothetical protein
MYEYKAPTAQRTQSFYYKGQSFHFIMGVYYDYHIQTNIHLDYAGKIVAHAQRDGTYSRQWIFRALTQGPHGGELPASLSKRQ